MTLPPPRPPVTVAEPAAPSRNWVKRAIIAFLIVANVVVFGVLGVVWLAAHKVSTSVSTIPSTDLSLADSPTSLQDARTFLVIGSDSRAGLTDLEGFGDFGGQRA